MAGAPPYTRLAREVTGDGVLEGNYSCRLYDGTSVSGGLEVQVSGGSGFASFPLPGECVCRVCVGGECAWVNATRAPEVSLEKVFLPVGREGWALVSVSDESPVAVEAWLNGSKLPLRLVDAWA